MHVVGSAAGHCLHLCHINQYFANWVPGVLGFITIILGFTAIFVGYKVTALHFFLLPHSRITLDCFSLVHKLLNYLFFARYAANILRTPLCEFQQPNANKRLTFCVKQHAEETCFTSTLLVDMMNWLCKHKT